MLRLIQRATLTAPRMTTTPAASLASGLAVSRRALLRGSLALAASCATPLAAHAMSSEDPTSEPSPATGENGRDGLVRQLIDMLDPDGKGREDQVDPIFVDLGNRAAQWADLVRRYATTRLAVDLNHGVRFDVAFAPGGTDISSQGHELLGIVAAALSSRVLADYTFMIGGHTDAAGDADANRTLSERRADAVRAQLVHRHGLEPSRIVSFGFGEDRLFKPDTPNHPDNRRVEIALIAGPAHNVNGPTADTGGAADDAYGADDQDYDRSGYDGPLDGVGDNPSFADFGDDAHDGFDGYGYDGFERRAPRGAVADRGRDPLYRETRPNGFRHAAPSLRDAWHTGPGLVPPGRRPQSPGRRFHVAGGCGKREVRGHFHLQHNQQLYQRGRSDNIDALQTRAIWLAITLCRQSVRYS